MDPKHPSEGAPRPFMGGRRRLLLGELLLATAFIYFAYLGFQGSSVYYLTIAEATNQEYQVEERLRVSGRLILESFEREPGSTLARFTLRDLSSAERLQVTYDGVLPDLFFNEHTEVVAEGEFNSNGAFQSDLILVKCPSKYESNTGLE